MNQEVNGPKKRRLTQREQHVLELAAQGKTDKEIADLLDISPHTVNNYWRRVFNKLRVHSRAAATGIGRASRQARGLNKSLG